MTKRIVVLLALSTLILGDSVLAKPLAEAWKLASYRREPTKDEISMRHSVEPLQEWLRRCSYTTESTERSWEVSRVYNAEKNIPKQSSPRFSQVTGPLSVFCKVKEDGTLHDFRVFISSGDEDFDFCGILILKAMRLVSKCPEDLPYQRGLIVNFSNRAGQARRSVNIAPNSLDADKYYSGLSRSNEAIKLFSENFHRRYTLQAAKLSKAQLEERKKALNELKKMKGETALNLIAAKCSYISDLIASDNLPECESQMEELTDIHKHNSLYGLSFVSPMENITQMLVNIIDNSDKNYSSTFVDKVKELIVAVEYNTDYGIRVKKPEDKAGYYGSASQNWISYSRFKDTGNSKFASQLVDTIYDAKKKRYEANIFPNQYFLENLLHLEEERNSGKSLKQYRKAIDLRKSDLTPANVLGTVENKVEDGDTKGAALYVKDVLKMDVVIRRDSRKWSKAFAELSTIFSNHNNLDLAEQLLRRAIDSGNTYVGNELKLLVTKYCDSNQYQKACDLYIFLGEKTGKMFYQEWTAKLQLEASVKNKAKQDYWFKKSEETYQNLLKYLKANGFNESTLSNAKRSRVKQLEESGYKSEAAELRGY